MVDATLEIRPLPHANGRVQTSLLFAFPDEDLVLPLSIVIEPVEDAGSIRLDWVRPLSGDQIEVRWTVEDRDDLTNVTSKGACRAVTGFRWPRPVRLHAVQPCWMNVAFRCGR